MQTHAIPQQISSYQFRLVGDMTLKQFFQIAGGALISLLIYSLPIMGIIKWPFVILFALLGVALAFLPLADRPLERWIAAFFRSVYSPTIFTFAKSTAPKVFFQEEAPVPEEKIIYPQGEAKLQEYLTAPPADGLRGKLEEIESSFLIRLSAILNPAATVPTQTPVVIPVVPQAAPRLVLEETRVPSPVVTAKKQADFSVEAAPPGPPTVPNTLTGQVVDADRKIVEGAILEIRDSIGQPVRALKSNKLGHFMVVTPLISGRYEIITEKDGFEFEPVSFQASGEIIPPVAISGRKMALENENQN